MSMLNLKKEFWRGFDFTTTIESVRLHSRRFSNRLNKYIFSDNCPFSRTSIYNNASFPDRR